MDTAPETEQEQALRCAQRRHLGWIAGSALILGAAFFVPWQRNPVSPCAFLNLTGYPCALCGSTRAFQAMAHGRWGEAAIQNPLASLLFLVVAATFAWHLLALILTVTRGCEVLPRITVRPRWWMVGAAVLLVLVNWAYRLGMGMK